MIALDLEEDIREAGAEVFASARSQQHALKAIEYEKPDAALLDLELSDGACIQLAQKLTDDKVPFAIISAFAKPMHPPPPLAEAPWFLKPVAFEDVLETLAQILQDSNYGRAQFPELQNQNLVHLN